jgi:hypothetical protein
MPIQFITPSIISSVANTQVTGTITASQIATVNANTITSGTIPLAQIPQLTGVKLPTGSVLQVVQTVKTDTFSTTSTTLVDITGLSVTITPSSASNKILVMVDLHIGYDVYAGIVHLLRGSTKIYAGDGGLTRCGLFSNAYAAGGDYAFHLIPVTAQFLDSPATTSATTYKLQTANYGSGTQYVNRTNANLNESTRDGLTASSITVMEIAA